MFLQMPRQKSGASIKTSIYKPTYIKTFWDFLISFVILFLETFWDFFRGGRNVFFIKVWGKSGDIRNRFVKGYNGLVTKVGPPSAPPKPGEAPSCYLIVCLLPFPQMTHNPSPQLPKHLATSPKPR